MRGLYLFLCFLVALTSPTTAQEITYENISTGLAIPSTISSPGQSYLKPSGAIGNVRNFRDDLRRSDVNFWRSTLLQQEFPKVNLEIRFHKDSVEIISEDKYIIGIIAEAISTPPLDGNLILIVGHTDSLGSDEHNLKLSQSRADAIKNILHENYDVPQRNLIAVGFGEALPSSDAAPEDPRNRRVELFNITLIE